MSKIEIHSWPHLKKRFKDATIFINGTKVTLVINISTQYEIIRIVISGPSNVSTEKRSSKFES